VKGTKSRAATISVISNAVRGNDTSTESRCGT